ncbi:hypothetical protein [Pseudonocardia sp. HH130630-07]|uniref:hypothetical protein n=1 Tax=Pseudonocardia sp. HH130630-07 TaxID=1690815 RepID=UPI000814BE20|nr:hypothetical protein [Pseudonocardia sp. HH130630-07]ANY09099.1 hypothetical protein AFB00_25750 [Pseudonocardia sp. HH130630-07]
MTGFALTWLVFALVLALFGARAWVVETNRGRLSTGGSAQRGLTVAVVGAIAALLVLLVLNGGATLAELVINRQTDITAPAEPLPGTDPAVPVPPAGDQVPAPAGDPAAPPPAAPAPPAN